jgi:hypothetical protein
VTTTGSLRPTKRPTRIFLLDCAFPDVALVTEEQAESHSVTANILIVDPLVAPKNSSTVVAILP